MTDTIGAAPREATFMAWVALAIFSIVTLFAYVDRAIFPLLAETLRVSLDLSDLQLGLLQGTGLALFAAAAYYPMGWLADRYDRRLVMVGAIAFWSLAVVGCGLARDFPTLFFCSAMVGAGEAALAPVFYSMIPDLFKGGKRQLANSIFGVTAASAGGLALAISGALPGLAEHLRPSLPATLQAMEAWRLSFFLAAAPAPLMMGLVMLAPLGGPRQKRESAIKQKLAPLLPYLRAEWSTLSRFILGVSLAVFGLQAIGSWGAVILMRYFGLSPAEVGAGLGSIALASTATGFALSLILTRLFATKLGLVMPLRAQWLAYALVAPLGLVMLGAQSASFIFMISALSLTLQTTANLLAPTVVQSLAPASVRARFVAIFFTCQLLCGAAAGPTVGLVSDLLSETPRSLMLAAVSLGAPSLICAALLLWSVEKGYVKTASANLALEQSPNPADSAENATAIRS